MITHSRKISEAIILAGGFGTRLREVIQDLPKPMAPINNIPFLEYLVKYLKHFGITKIIFSTGHLSKKISDYFGEEFNGISIAYSHEDTPLGTGGGIRLALEKCKDKEVLVMNGDSFFDIDLHNYFQLHQQSHSSCSLAIRKVEDASRYGTIQLKENGKIISFNEKNGKNEPGLINAGVYIINRDLYLKNTPEQVNFSIEKDFYEKLVSHFNIFGFQLPGYFIDIGIPEDYNKAQHDFKGFKY